jgi:protein-tyrosine phosphatase
VTCVRPGPLTDSYWIDDRLAAGLYPRGERAERVEAAGVRLFVDLTHPEDGLEPYADRLELARRVHHPIFDMGVPAVAEMGAILDVIDEALAEPAGGVYVHCWGGIGRAGTTVGCWLVRHGMDAHDAIDLIRSRRIDLPVYRRFPDSPQTREQHRFVHAWQPNA